MQRELNDKIKWLLDISEDLKVSKSARFRAFSAATYYIEALIIIKDAEAQEAIMRMHQNGK